ncbi:MAG: lamin tail domain-containing protein [Croceitalea sp.]|nr:lamin tail domain-containing protein [Croceitalea sp.]
MFRNAILPIFLALLAQGCINNNDFDSLAPACSDGIVATNSFEELKSLYQGELLQIQEDWVIEGYVVSSDRAGNFFSVLHFQDKYQNPEGGLQIEIDLRDSYLLFEPGQKILIKLKGLYLGQSKGVFKLGGTFAAFGTTSVGRLPALKVPEHVFRSCEGVQNIIPKQSSLANLTLDQNNTLVQFDNLEFVEEELDQSFAEPQEETERTLIDCDGNTIMLLNSGFADFQDDMLPPGNGSIVGVLLTENDDLFLSIRDLTDINFTNERCPELVTEFTSNQIIISELADPNNNAGARFLELYNAADEALDMNGWLLKRYTNANTEVSSTIDLSGFTIEGSSTFVISPNDTEFESVYGILPDLAVSTNSPADSNGDDNVQLVNPFGTVIDVFGIIGEDGTGTNHEFEDGRASRNLDVVFSNPIYSFSEWSIFNDTGGSGTINDPQNAPEDFTPGVR